MKRRWILIVILLLALVPLHAAQWALYRVPGAAIFVPPGQEPLAKAVGVMFADELPRLARALGVTHPDPLPIYVYTDSIAFARDAGAIPYLRGVSYHLTGRIRIDATQPEFRRTLAHELTHSLLSQRLGRRIGDLPLWCNEGIAGFLSDPLSRDALPFAAQQIHEQGVLAYDELSDAFDRNDQRDIAYLQSRSLIAWLVYRHPGALERLLADLAGGRDCEEALERAAGLTPEAWWRQWRREVPWWQPVLGLANSPVLFAPFAVLLVLIVLLRRMRAAREEDATTDEASADDDDAVYYDEDEDPMGQERPSDMERYRGDLAHERFLEDNEDDGRFRR